MSKEVIFAVGLFTIWMVKYFLAPIMVAVLTGIILDRFRTAKRQKK